MKKGEDYIGVAVVYLCHDGAGNYLFQKRSEACRDEHGRWDTGGGALEFGETVIETISKEIKEEYLTEVLAHEFLGYRDVHREHEGARTHWIALDFRVLVDRRAVGNGEPHKFTEIGWFTLDNLPDPLHSQLTGTIDLYRDRL